MALEKTGNLIDIHNKYVSTVEETQFLITNGSGRFRKGGTPFEQR